MKASCTALALSFALIFTQPLFAQSPGTLALTDVGRPVLKAALKLTEQYGYVITYEEPAYRSKDDLVDVSHDFHPHPAWRKILVPKGGNLNVTLPHGPLKPTEMYALLQGLVDSWNASDQGGAQFAVVEDGAVFHIVPTQIRDESGNWKSVTPVLETPISLATEGRTIDETFDAVAAAVAASAGVKVKSLPEGGIIMGPVQRDKYTLGASQEPAASVLMRTLKMMPTPRSWYLLYDPTTRAYFMNILGCPTVPPSNAP